MDFFLGNYLSLPLFISYVNPMYLFKFFLLLVDSVFGPTTTTRQVYDVAAQHIISGAMEGINGNWQIEPIASI